MIQLSRSQLPNMPKLHQGSHCPTFKGRASGSSVVALGIGGRGAERARRFPVLLGARLTSPLCCSFRGAGRFSEP